MSNRPTFAPLMLRLALGATFLWAGLGKVFTHIEVSGERAAALREMGVARTTTAPTPTDSPDNAETPDPSRPVPTEPLPTPPRPTTNPAQAPSQPSETSPGTAPGTLRLVAWPSQDSAATEPLKVERLYGLALLVRNAANPAPNADGTTPIPLWPAQLATGRLPVYFAWAAAVTELVAGILCILGFFTRLSALTLAGVMAVAIWLTEIGPAIQSGDTILGFLPIRETYAVALSPNGYVTLMWQVSLLSIALALTTLGAGKLSLDAALFGAGSGGPKPAPKPPAPRPAA